jgi:transposase
MERVDRSQPESGQGLAVMERSSVVLGKADQKSRFIEMRAKGFSYLKIAKELRVSKNTLCTWGKDLEAEISTLRAMETETLIEEQLLHREGRIQRLGGTISRVRDELDKRNLSSVSTERLMDLLLRYHSEAREEIKEIRPPAVGSSQRDGIGTELTSDGVTMALVDLIRRYQSGELEIEQAKQEAGLMLLLMKSIDQGELARKMEALEEVLGLRQEAGKKR